MSETKCRFRHGKMSWLEKSNRSDNSYDYHRAGAPAIITHEGEYWCHHGKFHREDGPAVVRRDGKAQFWLYGRCFSTTDWMERVNLTEKEKAVCLLKY